MKILGTGLSGLVGSRVVELLSPKHEFSNLSLETGVDITNKELTYKHIAASDAPWIFHFAAVTDVDGAEKERELGQRSKSWIVNVEATRYVAEAAARGRKKVLYISTDFVFDGTKRVYREDDVPNPLGWYAVTKYEGEKIIAANGDNLIIRISNPYVASVGVRPDFVHKIMDRLAQGLPVGAPDDQLFVPTFVDDIATAIGALMEADARGVYHVVGTDGISPYTVARKIAVRMGIDPSVVSATTFEKFFAGRAPRPFYAVLNNDKITSLGVHMSTFDEGLAKIVLSREKSI